MSQVLFLVKWLCYFPSIGGLTQQQKPLTRDLPPLNFEICVYSREIFLVLMPLHKLSTHCIFFSQLFDVLEGVFFLEQEATTPNVFKTEASKHLKFSSEFLSRNLARSPNLNWEKGEKKKKKPIPFSHPWSIKCILLNRKQTFYIYVMLVYHLFPAFSPTRLLAHFKSMVTNVWMYCFHLKFNKPKS